MFLSSSSVMEAVLGRRDAIPAENNIPSILATTASLTAISLFVVVLRFYVRVFMLKNFGSDDWVMALTACAAAAVLGCWVEETKTGIGWHIDDISEEQQMHLTKIMFIHGVINMNAVTFVKISVALNLRRFMQTKRQRMFLAGLIVFLIAFTITCSCTIIFNCIPVAATWDRELAKTAKCFSLPVFKGLAINNSVFNILTDFLLAVLPIPIVVRLHTNMRTKITLSLILSLGLFAGSAATVKAVKQFQFFGVRDYTWDADYWLWHDIELSVGIVAASLPALRPLFAAFYDRTLKYSYGAATRMGYGPSNGYAPGYGQGTNKQYLRHKNTMDNDLTKHGISLRSFSEREAFSGKRDAARIHTTEVTSNGRRGNRKASPADDLSNGSGNDYDSDEIILHPTRSDSHTGHQYGHGRAEEQAVESQKHRITRNGLRQSESITVHLIRAAGTEYSRTCYAVFAAETNSRTVFASVTALESLKFEIVAQALTTTTFEADHDSIAKELI
ncbi:hypothetical protein PMZ80_010573 [Knufia obscura]|uniref:Rhodopsin domain-containing protein n=1 Tax=Knufia obscura TaxID=1635080 RepID=A0ABR0R9H2_9EURO|nr:hypothetical protein PMZ80_010573 [Knufia obscura]